MKKLLLTFLLLVLALTLVSCGECEHIDDNNDGICDECEWNYDHEHTYADSWSHDEEHHWKGITCGHLAEVKDKALHSDENNDGVCDGCGWDYDHEHTYATEWSRDENNHWRSASCTHSLDVKDKDVHKDDNNDCLCDGCGWDYNHTYEADWSYDNENHWHAVTCPHEAAVGSKAPHVDTDTDGECDVCGCGEIADSSEGIELPEVEF